MQVTLLFATTFFALFTLVAPLAIQARVITSPAASRTTGKNIGFFFEPSPSVDSSSFLFSENAKRATPSTEPSASASPEDTGMAYNAGAVVGGVILGVVVVAALVFGVFLYKRRQQRQHAASDSTGAPAFNLEAGFHPHARSLSSNSASTAGDAVKLEEEDKARWEVTLEEQFARARAQTPDIPRGMTPLPRNESPMPLRQPPRSFRHDN